MDIAKISALSSSVKQEMEANTDVKNFVSTSKDFSNLVNALDIFLQPVLQAPTGRKLEQSYIGRYSEQPKYCRNLPILLFAPLRQPNKNGKISAFPLTWIVRLPLLSNKNSVSIYFPYPILQDSMKTQNKKIRTEPHKNGDYVIPIVLSDFIKNPEHYLCIEKIKKRINS